MSTASKRLRRTTVGSSQAADTLPKRPVPPPMERIGSFRLIREIGRGGMGVVYEAEQSNPQRRVALKLLRGYDTEDDLHAKLFEREIRTLARLNHPNIAAIYESGQTEDGRRYFVMEYVQGEMLLDYAEGFRGERTIDPMSVEDRLWLFVEVCDAINYAHQRGVIHRDIKPTNLLVDANGTPKVLDFGVARITDSDVAHTTVVTQPGRLLGTPAYMSPEQARGVASEIDVRADVYSLGVTLYELITDKLPYEVNSSAIPEVLRIISEQPPKRLSLVNSSYRGDLETIVSKALEKEPSQRYQSAAALGDDIERFLNGHAINARPASVIYQLRKFARRNRILVGGVAATFVVLLAGIIGTSRQAIRATRAEADARALAESEATQKQAAQQARDLANTERLIARREADRAQAINDFLLWGFGYANDELPNPQELTLRAVMDLASAKIGSRFVGRPGAEAAVRQMIGDVHMTLNEFDSAYEQYVLAYELLQGLAPRDDARLAALANSLNLSAREAEMGEAVAQRWLHTFEQILLRLLGARYSTLGPAAGDLVRAIRKPWRATQEESDAGLANVLDALAKDVAPDHRDGLIVADLLLSLGAYHFNTFGSREVRGYTEAALTIMRGIETSETEYVVNQDRRRLTVTLWLLAREPADPGEEQQRVDRARELVDMARKARRDDWFLLDGRGVLGEALLQRGRPEDRERGERLITESHAEIAKTTREDHGRTAIALRRVMQMHAQRGDWQAAADTTRRLARSLYRTPSALAITVLRRTNEEIATSLQDLAAAVQNRRFEAVPKLRDRLREVAADLPDDDPTALVYADALNRIGQQHRTSGGTAADTFALYEDALRFYRRQLPEDHAKIRRQMTYLASSLVAAGRYADAETLLREGLALCEANDPPVHPIPGMMRSHLARALVRQGRHEEAEPIARAAFDILLECETLSSANTNLAYSRALDLYAEWPRPELATAFASPVLAMLRDPVAPAFVINAVVWPIVRHHGYETPLYVAATDLARIASSEAPRDGAILNTLGVGQYRAGRYEECVETLTRCDALYVEAGQGEQPANWAFIAMAHQRLAQHQQGGAALARLRDLMRDPKHSASDENQAFLREAERLPGDEG